MKENVLLAYAFFTGYSVFLSALLFVNHRHSGNKLLGLILLLLTIRVGKSILSLAFPDWALPVNVIGLSSMAALGPVFLFYINGLYSTAPMDVKRMGLHLLPAIICLCLWTWPMISWGFYIVTPFLLCYLLYALNLLSRNSEIYSVDNVRWRWSKGTLLGLLILSLSFTAQLLFYAPVVYYANVGVSVAVLYPLSLWAVRQNRLFVEQPKKTVDPHDEMYVRVANKVKQLMEEEAYVDTDLKLTKVAETLNVKPYLLSKAVNSCFHVSFSELILGYRIHKAEELLVSPAHQAYTIEAIAYESGFQTLSAFYQAFRKVNGMTPTQYRKRMELKISLDETNGSRAKATQIGR